MSKYEIEICSCIENQHIVLFQVCVHGPQLEPSEYTRWYATRFTDQGTVFELGSVIYGQRKELLIPMTTDVLRTCAFSLTYDTLQEKQKLIKFNIDRHPREEDFKHIARQRFRLRSVHCVRSLFEAMRQKLKNPSIPSDEINMAKNQLKALEQDMKRYPDRSDEFVKDLLADLTGQVEEATGKEEWFKKWGVHFLPSLTRKLIQSMRNIDVEIIFSRCTSSSIL